MISKYLLAGYAQIYKNKTQLGRLLALILGEISPVGYGRVKGGRGKGGCWPKRGAVGQLMQMRSCHMLKLNLGWLFRSRSKMPVALRVFNSREKWREWIQKMVEERAQSGNSAKIYFISFNMLSTFRTVSRKNYIIIKKLEVFIQTA